MNRQYGFPIALGAAALSLASSGAFATCQDISWNQLNSAALFVKNTPGEQVLTGGLKNNMWVTMVDETGKVCHVVNTAGPGQNSGSTWALSRVISAQKANTSVGLSLNAVGANPLQAWASGALILAAMPVLDPTTGLVGAGAGTLQGTLYGVQFSNPIRVDLAYVGNPNTYGTPSDPLKNKRIGGINVFGGGLPLYAALQKIGAIGVSGDSSCTDHAFAWRVREKLAADFGINNAVQIAAASSISEVLNITGKLYPGCAPVNPPFLGLTNGLQ